MSSTSLIYIYQLVFREIRLKYGYTRDDELGSKPNDWLKDGLNNVNYTVVARERKAEYLYVKTDVSMIRATNIAVTLNGTNLIRLDQGKLCKLFKLKVIFKCLVLGPTRFNNSWRRWGSRLHDFSIFFVNCSKIRGFFIKWNFTLILIFS